MSNRSKSSQVSRSKCKQNGKNKKTVVKKPEKMKINVRNIDYIQTEEIVSFNTMFSAPPRPPGPARKEKENKIVKIE